MTLKSQYNSLCEWRLDKPQEYNKAKKNGLLPEIAKLYGWKYRESKPNGYWNEEKIKNEIKDFTTIKEWIEKSPSSLWASRRLGIYEKVSSHIKRKVVYIDRKPDGYWTEEKIIKDFTDNSYKNYSDWHKRGKASCRAAERQNIHKIILNKYTSK